MRSVKAVVTGAASGIGRAVALRLARQGAQLLLVDISEDGLGRVAAEVAEAEGQPRTLVADLGQPAAGEAVAGAARELGGVDAFVSNAGVFTSGPLEELSLETYDLSFDVNTRATWLLAKALLPMLRESRGAIVATASIAGHEPTAPLGGYSAGKAALLMLVRQMAYEWGPYGIRVNSVSPGLVHTGMTENVYSDPTLAATRAACVPLNRIGSPDEVAAAIGFLLSDDAAYISGADIVVDGGLRTTLMAAVRNAS